MSTFYERKLSRIIKSLQDDLPNVKLCETESSRQEVQRLKTKRDNLQQAKSLTIWKVGSDGLNNLMQNKYKMYHEKDTVPTTTVLKVKEGFHFCTKYFDEKILEAVEPNKGMYSEDALHIEDPWLCFDATNVNKGQMGFYTTNYSPNSDEVVYDKLDFIEEIRNMGVNI